MSSASVCVCVYWRSPQHTHACRLVVAWHMRIKFWASARLCVCECVWFFFLVCSPHCAQSEGAAVAEIRIDTHTRTYACLYFVKRCAAVPHTHIHMHLYLARVKCERRNFWLSAATFRSLLRLAISLCRSNYLLLLRQCLCLGMQYCQPACTRGIQMKSQDDCLFFFISLTNIVVKYVRSTTGANVDIYVCVCVCMRVGVHAQQIVKAIIRTYKKSCFIYWSISRSSDFVKNGIHEIHLATLSLYIHTSIYIFYIIIYVYNLLRRN